MYDEFIKAQMLINENYNLQIELILKQLNIMLEIIEDHEKDMIKMAEEINELKQQLSKNEG